MKRYSYAVYVLQSELEICNKNAQRPNDKHFLDCNEKRIDDLKRALKKLGVEDVSTADIDDGSGDPGGGGGGPNPPPPPPPPPGP